MEWGGQFNKTFSRYVEFCVKTWTPPHVVQSGLIFTTATHLSTTLKRTDLHN